MNDRKMKRYIAAVRFRLNLPRAAKDRIMGDFTGAIAERREAGQTDREILEALGSPKAVAAELNEQMKEYTYRKSPWRFLFLAAAILSGGWLLLRQLLLRFGLLLETLTITASGEAASIGVIGGADGPTSVFVASAVTQGQGMDWEGILFAGILAVSIFAFVRLRRCRNS